MVFAAIKSGRPEQITCPALRKIAPECPAEQAVSLAERPSPEARAIELDKIPSVIAEVDLVVCSTGARYRKTKRCAE